ncbi:MAG: tetratricopeptide repeat protein [Endomicrobia bacterium]|nr:tetratricopeptide repeat protein [Endomicrobiia bacterium]MCL2507499.1 tetratricopeptide repeat protein [Endomicrobiia bacterium]
MESKISGSEINEIYTSVYNAKNKKEKTALTELLAEKFIEKEQYSEAEDIYKDLLGANPSKKKRFEYYLKIGDIAVLEKNYALALDYYGKAKSLYKKNVMVNSKMGDVFLMSNLYNLAERSFLEVLSVDKNYRYAKKRLGDTYFQRGLYSKALSYYEQINNAEDDKELIINMVASYRNISETDKALALVREYLSKNNAAEIFFLSGLLHSDKKNYDLAEEDFLMSIKLDENNFTPSIYLASIYYDAGKYKQAKFYADKAYLLNSSYAATDLLNAKISYKMKRIYDARRYAHNAFIKAKTPFMKERAQQLIAYLQEIK